MSQGVSTDTRRARLRGVASVAVLAAVLVTAPRAGALQLTAGPVEQLPGGFEMSSSDLDPSCGGSACTGFTENYIVRTPGAFADLYWGLQNTLPIPEQAIAGIVLDGKLATFRYRSSTPRSITYTSWGPIRDASLGVVNLNHRLVMTLIAGTGVVVDTEGNPANNDSGDIQKLFRITGNTFSVRIEVTSNALPRTAIGADTLMRGTFRPSLELFNTFDATSSGVLPIVSVPTGFYYLLCAP